MTSKSSIIAEENSPLLRGLHIHTAYTEAINTELIISFLNKIRELQSLVGFSHTVNKDG